MQLRRSHFSTAGISKNPAYQKFYIHFFIDNYNANISLYALSCPNLVLGQLKVCKMMFALELSMKKWIKKIWIAGFSVITAIIAFGFSLDKIDILRNNKSYTFDFLHTNPPLLILSPLNIMYFMYENICPSHRWQRWQISVIIISDPNCIFSVSLGPYFCWSHPPLPFWVIVCTCWCRDRPFSWFGYG